MPRRSEKITTDEIKILRDMLAECDISDSLRKKLQKRLDNELQRRENAGKLGGRPKKEVIEEIERIDREGAAQIEKPKGNIDENFDFGA